MAQGETGSKVAKLRPGTDLDRLISRNNRSTRSKIQPLQCTGQVRSGQVRSGQVRSGQVRSGQVRSGQARECAFDIPVAASTIPMSYRSSTGGRTLQQHAAHVEIDVVKTQKKPVTPAALGCTITVGCITDLTSKADDWTTSVPRTNA